jgi:hypothetical protein
MRARGLARRRTRRWGAIATAVAAVALVAVGCGSKSFENKPRAAVPVEVTASVGPRAVRVSPGTVGAGLVNFTVANLSSNPASFQLRGRTSASTGQIEPGAVTTISEKLKTGTYQASAGGGSGIQPTTIKVGPPRHSSQNKLLLP